MSTERPDLLALDVDGALAEAHEGLTRAGFIVTAGLAAAGFAAARTGDAHAAGIPASDEEILNYALVLEYLQAAFYTEAERAKALTGRTAKAAKAVGAVERAHVKAFRDLLGKKAVGRPHFDFQGVTEANRPFLKTAVAFEDLAVAAYKGQARRIRSRAVLTSALGIHTVEARHAAWMRYLNGYTPAVAAFDRPQSRKEIDKLVASTHFITAPPRSTSERKPGFTG
jgi:rubrerythrin